MRWFASEMLLLIRKRLAWPILFAASLLCGAAQADIYKWVAEDGVTHYSEHKPPIQAPVETIVEERRDKPEPIAVETAQAGMEEAEPAAPPPPKVCDGEAGRTAVGTLAMLLNRAYIGSIPEFVADNSAMFASDELYDCLDAIFANALLHDQITGGDTGTVSPDAPLAVLLESSTTLAAALQELNTGANTEWQKILNHMRTREPRLDADIGALTRLIRGVIVDAQANTGGRRLQAGAP